MEIMIKQKAIDPYGTSKRSEAGQKVMQSPNWVEGWWENIGPKPIYIRDKYHLKEVCQKHGVIPKAFAKPKSQGKGLEWSF